MEIAANNIFQQYTNSYYEGGVSSVYVWELEEGFAAAILIKKGKKKTHDLDGTGNRELAKGCWDSIHVVEVKELTKDTASYKLATTVILSLQTEKNNLDLSGNVQRQVNFYFKR
jgi:capping protein (actin filament) muscle Z-line, beta